VAGPFPICTGFPILPLKRAPEQGVYVQNGKGDVKGVADWRVTLYYAFCPGQGFLITNLLELFRLTVVKNESAVLITTASPQRHRDTKGFSPCLCVSVVKKNMHHKDAMSLITIIRVIR
jgi:uncharacterized membrane protein